MKKLLTIVMFFLLISVHGKGQYLRESGSAVCPERYEYYTSSSKSLESKMLVLMTAPAYGEHLKGVKYEGNVFIYPQYQDVACLNTKSFVQVKDEKGWFFVNLYNKPLFDARFDSILPFVATNNKFEQRVFFIPTRHDASFSDFLTMGLTYYEGRRINGHSITGCNKVSTPLFDKFSLAESSEKFYAVDKSLEGYKNEIVAREKKQKKRIEQEKLRSRISEVDSYFLFIAKKNGKWGIADGEGKWVVNPVYQHIDDSFKQFAQIYNMWFFYATEDGGSTNIIDILGNVVRENVGDPSSDILKNRKKFSQVMTDAAKLSKSELKCITDGERVMAYLDVEDSLLEATIRTMNRLDTIRPSVKLIPVQNKNKKWGFIDKENKLILDYVYDEVLDNEATHAYRVSQNGKYGVVNFRGEVIPCIFDFINAWDSVGNSTALFAPNFSGDIQLFYANINEWGYCGLTLEPYLEGRFEDVYVMDSTNYANLHMLAYHFWNRANRTDVANSAILSCLSASMRHSAQKGVDDFEAMVWYDRANSDNSGMKISKTLSRTTVEYQAEAEAKRQQAIAEAQARQSSSDLFLNNLISFLGSVNTTLQNIQQTKAGSNANTYSSSSSSSNSKQSTGKTHNLHPGMSQSELQGAYNAAISNIRVIMENWSRYVGTYAEVSQKDNLRSIKATIARIKRQASEHGVTIATNQLETWEPK